MKKPRVGIEEVTHYQVVVEQAGRRYVVAIADDMKQAKKYAKEAEKEHGIRRPKK
jgi:ribosomal silencing factor RsfS